VAYELTQRGKKVALLEDGNLCSGETGRTSAHLAPALDDHWFNIQSKFGDEGAKLIHKAHTQAVANIEQICKQEKIECEFSRVDGYVVNEFDRKKDGAKHAECNANMIQKEWKAVQKLGLPGVSLVEKLDFMETDCAPAIKFANQAQFNPNKYCAGLARAIVKDGKIDTRVLHGVETNGFVLRGSQIFTNTHAKSVNAADDETYVLTANGHRVFCQHVVVATNSPFNNRIQLIDRVSPYRSYVIAARVPRGSIKPALIWDTADPYHYVRVTPDLKDDKSDLLIIGGEDHKVGMKTDQNKLFTKLEAWAKERWPQMGEIEFKWSGQILEPVDYIGFTGRNPNDKPNVYVHTGDSGNGLTHAGIAAMIIPDLIMGKENEFAKVFSPSRSMGQKLPSYVGHAVEMQTHYANWLKGSEVRDIEDLQLCSGAVIKRGLKPVAVYKDENGKVHEMSAICPHLYGIVEWNQEERSFDCPVHGSRFSAFGDVICGPANCGMSRLGEHDASTRSSAPGGTKVEKKEKKADQMKKKEHQQAQQQQVKPEEQLWSHQPAKMQQVHQESPQAQSPTKEKEKEPAQAVTAQGYAPGLGFEQSGKKQQLQYQQQQQARTEQPEKPVEWQTLEKPEQEQAQQAQQKQGQPMPQEELDQGQERQTTQEKRQRKQQQQQKQASASAGSASGLMSGVMHAPPPRQQQQGRYA